MEGGRYLGINIRLGLAQNKRKGMEKILKKEKLGQRHKEREIDHKDAEE